MAFDRQAGRIVVLATREDPSSPETWTFDVCTNTWTQMHPSQEPPGRVQIVYDAKSDLTIALDSVGVWAYDLAANTWTAKGVAPLAPQGGGQPRLVYDPVSGLVVAQAFASSSETETPSELWTYDVETDTWFPFRRAGAPAVGLFGLLAYDASVDRIIGYAGVPSVTDVSYRTRLFDIRTGTWSTAGAVTPAVSFGWGPSGGEIAYDETMERTIVFSDGRVVACDAAADRWEILVEGFVPGQSGAWPTGPTARLGPSMVYDPVNGRLVVYGGQYRTSDPNNLWVQADDVLAFDPATRQWTVLLEASEVRPIPQ